MPALVSARLLSLLTAATLAAAPLAQVPPAPQTAAPQPASSKAPAAEDRVLSFPGHGRLALPASVRPAASNTAHPYFAVLVAGSGPTDRDWSNPLMGRPSHGGRDLAQWLAARGIGSLRYDKRFLCHPVAGLDISVEAQVGDILGAIRAARALPEAKGRRILLVGHSEGTLLSLKAASEADALLLLAMPAESMKQLLLTQVKGQLVSVGAQPRAMDATLAYLEAALGAVQKGEALPVASPDIPAGVRMLAESLGNPVNRTFLKDMLGLDPWPLAAGLKIPHAVAWGDHDSQTARPAQVPASFRGAVLEIAGANHVLKRETRPLASLAPGAAMATYGDDTPQADLGVLERWLGTLRP